MTVYKKHVRPDGSTGKCTASSGTCPYSQNEHFFYDSGIGKKVIDPNGYVQKRLDRLSLDDLHKAHKSPSDDAVTAYDSYNDLKDDFDDKKAKMLSSFPEDKHEFLRQLLDSPVGPSLIGSFEIYDPKTQNTLESSSTDEEKVAFAKSYLKMNEAEHKYRMTVSSDLA